MKSNTLIYFIGSGSVAAILIVAIISAWINFTVMDSCKRAKATYKLDDCVTALTTQLRDESQSYGDRNDAIWALGQYGDSRALSALNDYYTGKIPEREPWNETISQYELSKAINLLKGGFNLSVIFRALILAPTR